MTISIYSLITAFIWFNLFILLSWLFRSKLGLFLQYNLSPLIFLVALTVIRLLAPIETPFPIVIRLDRGAPELQDFLLSSVSLSHSSSPHIGTLHVWTIITVIALTGSVYFLFRLAMQHWRTRNYMLTLDEWESTFARQMMDEIMTETKSVRSYRLVLSQTEKSPKTVGFRTPTIILPANIEVYSHADQYHFLRHEWQHHINKDLWVKLFIECLCRILWWDPLVYLLRYNLDQTLELKCDVRITRNMSAEEQTAYLTAIYNALEKLPRTQKRKRLSLTAVSMQLLGPFRSWKNKQDNLSLEQRFELVQKYSKRNRKAAVVFFVAFSILFLTSFAFVIQPYYAAPPEDGMFELQEPPPGEGNIMVFDINADTAYIVDNKDGTFTLYMDDEIWLTLTEEELKIPPHNTLPIIEKDIE